MVEIIYNKDKAELDKIVANIIANSIDKMYYEKDHFILGLPGGRSVIGIYNLLKNKKVYWKKIHIFMLDERLVPLDEPTSNFKLANDLFIKHLISNNQIPEENVHPFNPNPELPDYGIKDYEAELKEFGGAFDIILLSSGEMGQVASLFPYHPSIRDDSKYFVIVNNSPKPPKDRMTISRELLLKSTVGILLFIDEVKRTAFNNLKNESLNYEACPAKLVLSLPTSFVVTNLK
ncbi:6-phosphogluconolactonase [[Eubacterium] cellulosolvens]